MLVVLKHGSHLIERGVFLAEAALCSWPPYFLQNPLSCFASTIHIVLSVFVRFFEKQNADCEAKHNNARAHQIRKEVRESLENGTSENGKYLKRVRKQASESSANDGSVERLEIGRVLGKKKKKKRKKVPGPHKKLAYPRHHTKGMME